ncbi:MAG: hypothetical protein EU548_05520 [Promethearchaeota archaeon]|nr:MAG: hypothetical protein EU548_05520 [Candidatus Lokiarchaeota archaeon]
MSDNIKDLIEKAEEDDKTRAVMEKTIQNLKMEVKKLQTKLEAKKEVLRPPSLKSKEEEKEESTIEIHVLKEMVSSLRDEVIQRDQEKEKLSEKVKKLTEKLDQMKEKESDTVKEEILLKTQNSLNNLIEDYSKLETDNKLLKQKIAEYEQDQRQSLAQIDKEKTDLDRSESLKREIDSLKDQISAVERKNQSLLQDIKVLEKKSSSSEELDALVEKLKQNNTHLEKENKELSEKLEELKREKLRIMQYERKISNLTDKITELEKSNKLLKKRGSILLAKTITAMDLSPRKSKQTNQKELPQVEPLSISSERVQKSDVDLEKPSEDQKLAENAKSSKETEAEAKVAPPLKKEEPHEVAETSLGSTDEELTRKWQCPHCGNSNKAQIREVDDKKRPIWGNFYAKKYVCGQCGKEWR